jgi:hypothetical protein
MAYVITKTTGEKLTIVNDGTIDQTTNLTLVGRNYSNFGQIINENFVKLLENFANTTAPTAPIMGQLWCDSANKKLKVYNGSLFTGLPQIISSASQPSGQTNGDMWYNTSEQKLYLYDNSTYNLIGPQFTGISELNAVIPSQVFDNVGTTHYILKHNLENILTGAVETVAVTAAESFQLAPGAITGFDYIKRGFNLYSATASGVSVSGNATSDTVLWGTAQSALNLVDASGNPKAFVQEANPLISGTLLPSNPATLDVGSSTVPFRAIYANTNIATYADLAERYRSDAHYDEGTVLVVGGSHEVTICRSYQDERVAGVVSLYPAYAMNEDLAGIEPPELAPYIALKGRVPCKVKGPVKKGDLLVTSEFPGHAESKKPGLTSVGIIGKALQDFSGDYGRIEIMV